MNRVSSCLLPLLSAARCAPSPFAPTSSLSFSTAAAETTEYIDFPGGRIPYTNALSFVGGPQKEQPKIPGYWTIDMLGKDVAGVSLPHPVGQELATKLYECMATLQVWFSLHRCLLPGVQCEA